MASVPSIRGARAIGRVEFLHTIARAGDSLEYAVVNTGERPLRFGAGYALERRDSGRWQLMNADQAFHAWARHLAPGERVQLTARLPAGLPAGSYRVRKRLSVVLPDRPGVGEPLQAIAELTIEPSGN